MPSSNGLYAAIAAGLGLLCLGIFLRDLARGATQSSNRTYTREDDPRKYWLYMMVNLGVSLFMAAIAACLHAHS